MAEVHVAPGMVDEFEASAKARAARMAEGNVTFGYRAAVSEGGVYRFTTLLESDFASLDRRREQLALMRQKLSRSRGRWQCG